MYNRIWGVYMKRINSIRQIKKHVKPPFDRYLPFTVYTYTDSFYDRQKGIFIDKADVYYVCGNFKSKTVTVSFKRRKPITDD